MFNMYTTLFRFVHLPIIPMDSSINFWEINNYSDGSLCLFMIVFIILLFFSEAGRKKQMFAIKFSGVTENRVTENVL